MQQRENGSDDLELRFLSGVHATGANMSVSCVEACECCVCKSASVSLVMMIPERELYTAESLSRTY